MNDNIKKIISETSEETKQKMSESKTGKNNPMYNKRHSKEIQEKIREYAIKAFKAVDGHGLSRVDFFLDKKTNNIYLNEIMFVFNDLVSFAHYIIIPFTFFCLGYLTCLPLLCLYLVCVVRALVKKRLLNLLRHHAIQSVLVVPIQLLDYQR